jgi:hypothetical protein
MPSQTASIWEIVTAISTGGGTLWLVGSAIWKALNPPFAVECFIQGDVSASTGGSIAACDLTLTNGTRLPLELVGARALHGFEIANVTSEYNPFDGMKQTIGPFGPRVDLRWPVSVNGEASTFGNIFAVRPVGRTPWTACRIELQIRIRSPRVRTKTLRIDPAFRGAD